jgi:hypothetical protein
MHKFITNNKSLEQAAEWRAAWSKTWGAYATAPLIDGLGFHNRNAASNVMLNMTAGITNPAHYSRGIALQRYMARAFNDMSARSIPFDEALDAIKMSDADRAMIRYARDNGIVDKGWFADLAPTTGKARPRGQGVLTKYDGSWDFLQNNVMITKSRAFGSAVEQNARLAHFIAKIQAGESVDASARSVRKFLFDYGDLTGVEQSIKYLSRFYTFMRKNAGVQMWALTRNPGRVNAIQRGTGGGIGGALGINTALPGQPGYSNERGDTMSLGGVLGIGSGGSLVGGIETPFQAFSETFIRPLVQMAGIIEGDGTTGKDLAMTMMGITSGGPRALVDRFYETVTGQHAAFGRPLTEYEKGLEHKTTAWIEALVGPALSQFDTAIERITSGEGVNFIGNNPSATSEKVGPEQFVLSNILGLNQAYLDDPSEQATELAYQLDAELRLQLDDMRDAAEAEYLEANPNDPEGTNFVNPVPTIQDLRNSGILITPEGGATRAGSVITQDKIDRANVLGLPTVELDTELAERLETESSGYYQIDPETGEYTTQSGRAHDMAAELGIYVLDDEGNPKTNDDGTPRTSVNSMVKAEWNRRHPDQPYLNSDGTPVDYYNVPVVWPTATVSEVLAWLRDNNADISPYRTTITNSMRAAYNGAHPDRPQLTIDQRLDAGLVPLQGVYEHIRQGQKIGELWPEGMSADSWTVGSGTVTAPAASSGTSALTPDSGTSSLFGSGELPARFQQP